MTYIKWKDEVESYLVSLPQEEKQKIFSYFSEMYADKRDAGKSEAQIIEEFGAPYDVAKKILAESREAANAQSGESENAANVSGGNNYNYNYYNYNYGGAPQSATPQSGKELPERKTPPAPAPQEKPKKQTNAVKILVSIILTVVLVGLTVSLFGSALTVILEGFVSIGFTVGGLASGSCGGAEGTQMIGLGLIISGVGITLLAPFNALCSFLWRKLRAFMKGV